MIPQKWSELFLSSVVFRLLIHRALASSCTMSSYSEVSHSDSFPSLNGRRWMNDDRLFIDASSLPHCPVILSRRNGLFRGRPPRQRCISHSFFFLSSVIFCYWTRDGAVGRGASCRTQSDSRFTVPAPAKGAFYLTGVVPALSRKDKAPTCSLVLV